MLKKQTSLESPKGGEKKIYKFNRIKDNKEDKFKTIRSYFN